MNNNGLLGLIALILVLIGGINWGLVGLFNINLVSMLFGAGLLGRLIYIIIGVSAGFLIYLRVTKKA